MNALIEQCRRLGVRLRVEGGALAYDAPRGALTPELIAGLKANKPSILAALAHPDLFPRLPPAAEARRRKVLALARDGKRYAVYVEDPNTNPVLMALATPNGTCELQIPRDQYDPFAVLAIVKEWEHEDPEPDRLWGRVAITEPGARTVEVDTPSGWTLPDWQAYAKRCHGPGCAVTPKALLPKPRAPVNLDEALEAACDGVAGMTPAQFRALLSPEDVADIEVGGIHPKTLHAYAESFAERLRSGRIAALPERKGAKPAPLLGSVAITEAEIEAARKGRTVVRQGDFTGAPEVTL